MLYEGSREKNHHNFNTHLNTFIKLASPLNNVKHIFFIMTQRGKSEYV